MPDDEKKKLASFSDDPQLQLELVPYALSITKGELEDSSGFWQGRDIAAYVLHMFSQRTTTLRFLFQQYTPYLLDKWQATASAMLPEEVQSKYLYAVTLVLPCMSALIFTATGAFYQRQTTIIITSISMALLFIFFFMGLYVMLRGSVSIIIDPKKSFLTNEGSLLYLLVMFGIIQNPICVFAEEESTVYKKLKQLENLKVLILKTEFSRIWSSDYKEKSIAFCNIADPPKKTPFQRSIVENTNMSHNITAIVSVYKPEWKSMGTLLDNIPYSLQSTYIRHIEKDPRGNLEYQDICKLLLLFGLRHRSLKNGDTGGVNLKPPDLVLLCN